MCTLGAVLRVNWVGLNCYLLVPFGWRIICSPRNTSLSGHGTTFSIPLEVSASLMKMWVENLWWTHFLYFVLFRSIACHISVLCGFKRFVLGEWETMVVISIWPLPGILHSTVPTFEFSPISCLRVHTTASPTPGPIIPTLCGSGDFSQSSLFSSTQLYLRRS